MIGGNMRAAQGAGLPVGRIFLITTFIAGAAAGLAGGVEIAAVHHQANASLLVGYGFTGILVSFLARHNPLAIVPVAVLFGGLGACSSVLQRKLGLYDAHLLAFQGLLFVTILTCETFYGRFKFFQPREAREVVPV
jgi:simple sugar transport system permease protein